MERRGNLRIVTAEFNAALLSAVFKKAYELRQKEDVTDIELFRFDFDSCEKVPVDNRVSSDNLNYYWIEYKENGARKKFAFFFKDIDINKDRLNVHVVPGIFEEYEYKTDISEIPQAFFDENIGRVVINNFKGDYLEEFYPFFAEQDADGGWWCPSGKNKSVPLKPEKEGQFYPVEEAEIETISDFRAVFDRFAECEFAVPEKLFDELCDELYRKSGKKVKKKTANRTERYTPICWYNFNGKENSIFLTKPVFFLNYGFFTQYNCIALNQGDKDSDITKAGNKIIQIDVKTNYPVVKTAEEYKNIKAPSMTEGFDRKVIKKKLIDFLIEKMTLKED